MKKYSDLVVPLGCSARTTARVYAAEPALRTGALLVLAHGAGAGQHSPFMTTFAGALAALGIDVVTFDFLYAHERRKVPDRGPALEACLRAVVAIVDKGQPLFIGGKSMGGRIATQIAAADRDLPAAGLVLLGYPLHPPGQPDKRRDAHLVAIRRPMLVVQGSRDAFGTPAELAPVLDRLSPRPTLQVVEGGDHSFKLRGRNVDMQVAVYDDVQRTIAEWIARTMAKAATRTNGGRRGAGAR